MFRLYKKKRGKAMINQKTIFQLYDQYQETSKPIIVRNGKLIGYGRKES